MYRSIVLLLSVVALVSAPLSAQQTEMMRVNAARVNMRTAPSIDSSIVRGLAKGTVVNVLSHDGNWVKVQMQGQAWAGWVRSDLLIPVPTSATSDATMASSPSTPPPAATPANSMSSGMASPPPAPKPAPAPKMAPPPTMHAAHNSDNSYHGGFTIFGGITSYKVSESSTGVASVSTDNASGIAAGLGFIAHLGGPIGLEVDAAYVQKGGASTIASTTYKTQFNLGQGSLLLRPAFGSGKVRFFLLAGGEIGYMVNCKTTATGGTGTPAPCRVVNFKRNDYGAVGGAGISFGPLSVQVRYDYGMANISNTAGSTVKNRGIMVLGGLVF